MMPTLIALAVATGILIGLIALDFSSRHYDRQALKEDRTSLESAMKALGETHNSLVTQMKDLSHKVEKHEMTLNGDRLLKEPPFKKFI